MGVVDAFRKWRQIYFAYRHKKKVEKITTLKALVNDNPNLNSISIEQNRFILSLQDGLRFEWDPYIRNSCLGFAYNECYEELELKIIKDIILPKYTVFDIGANFGYFSITMKQFCSDIVLHSFEPIAETFKLFERNIALNHISGIITHQLGLSNQNAALTFYVPDQLGDAWASMGKGVAKVLNQPLREETCVVTKLDDFVLENEIHGVDFIKCDVEGAEQLVVLGAQETLLRDHPTLMLEIGDKWSSFFGYRRQDLIQQLINDFGYECFGVFNNTLIAINAIEEVQQYSEDQLYNYFFVHPLKNRDLNLLKDYTSFEYR